MTVFANQSTGAEKTNPLPEISADKAFEEGKKWANLKGQTSFQGNYDQALTTLAQKIMPDGNEWETLKEAIKTSVEKNLAKGNTIEALWEYLEKEGCTDINVIGGYLRFAKNGTEISIRQFRIPGLSLEATPSHTNLAEIAQDRRNAIRIETQQKLGSLLMEINA